MRPDLLHLPRLQGFRAAKDGEIAMLTRLEAEGRLPALCREVRPSFSLALRRAQSRNRYRDPHKALPAVIAEYKRASPSRGDIAPQLRPEEVAAAYATAGAHCLSVLTEEAFFRGELSYLSRMAGAGLPMLRKDFLFHPLQIRQTAATPASALLLIARLTPNASLLRDLREKTEDLGMEAVVEVFDAADLALARASGAKIIQVNARDLDSFAVDRAACLDLAEQFRHSTSGKNEVWIAASGMDQHSHLVAAAQAGFDAVLVGTALMQDARPGKALTALLAGSDPARSEA